MTTMTAPVVPGTILDVNGRPFEGTAGHRLATAKREVAALRRQVVRAKYDAAQTSTGNELHWSNADNLDPHAANSYEVRRKLRARSRYETMENNPFLKGTLLTIANDFAGKGCVRLKITDKRISKDRRIAIEERFAEWSKKIRLRHKIWQMRMAKISDGEAFGFAFNNRRLRHPIQLDFNIHEADQVSSQGNAIMPGQERNKNEIDGIRFDGFNQPLEYHLLKQHPGASFLSAFFRDQVDGNWIKEKFVVHWFRQDRPWLRGIPETTPSLPLCALLRRYTLAVVRHKEIAADFSAILETEGPPTNTAWTDGAGNLLDDDPFDVFPVEMGMMTTMPWGYKMKQLESVPDGIQYDSFVGSLLREITRPILAPYNIAVGTSKDSNMASAVVDTHLYRGGQEVERTDCEEVVLDHFLWLWWMEAIRMPGHLGDDFLQTDNTFREEPPKHSWGWDAVGLEHTDPAKIANALKTMHDKRFMTDRDIQESRFNRTVEEWQEQIAEDDEFRKTLGPAPGEDREPVEDPEDAKDDKDAKEEKDNAPPAKKN